MGCWIRTIWTQEACQLWKVLIFIRSSHIIKNERVACNMGIVCGCPIAH